MNTKKVSKMDQEQEKKRAGVRARKYFVIIRYGGSKKCIAGNIYSRHNKKK